MSTRTRFLSGSSGSFGFQKDNHVGVEIESDSIRSDCLDMLCEHVQELESLLHDFDEHIRFGISIKVIASGISDEKESAANAILFKIFELLHSTSQSQVEDHAKLEG